MPADSVSTIEKAAEEAIREASGDWTDAARRLRERLDENDQLREDLLSRSLRSELRQAAFRLGLSSVECLSCGEAIPVDATICRYCGHETGARAPALGPVAPAKPPAGGHIIRHFTLLTGWILIVLIVILLIAFMN